MKEFLFDDEYLSEIDEYSDDALDALFDDKEEEDE